MEVIAQQRVARFITTPDISLVDFPVHIELVGLMSYQQVKIRARRPSKVSGIAYESYAVFQSDETGTVHVETQAPLEGTYSGIDAMGLFWSMQRIEMPESNGNLAPLDPILYTLTAECEGKVVAQKSIERRWYSAAVQRTSVRENGLVATYFHHSVQGPRPGIIVLGGSEGGLSESTAALLASHGYATLALAYFGTEHLPSELVNIPLEYVEAAIDWFASQLGVNEDWIGLHGTSKGGELALLAASQFSQIKAVVCVSSGGVVLHGIQPKGADTLPPSWTYRGQPIPYASSENPYRSGKLATPNSNVISYRPWYDAHTSDEEVVQKALIPVERIQGGLLFISGEDDQMINSARLSQLSLKRLDHFNHPYHFEHHVYPEAGHVIGVPYLPTITRGEVPSLGMVWVCGGSRLANAHASLDSWKRILEFFRCESAKVCGDLDSSAVIK